MLKNNAVSACGSKPEIFLGEPLLAEVTVITMSILCEP
jgi:hypothetical protein